MNQTRPEVHAGAERTNIPWRGGQFPAIALVLLFAASSIGAGFLLNDSSAARPGTAVSASGIPGGPVALASGSTAPTSAPSLASAGTAPGSSVPSRLMTLAPQSAGIAPLSARLGALSLPQSSSTLSQPPAVPAAVGTDSNWGVVSPSWVTSAAQVGPSPTNMLAAGWDYGTTGNYSGPSSFLVTHGEMGLTLEGASVNSNGGNTFSTEWPGQAPAWSSSSNPSYTDVFEPAPRAYAYTGGPNTPLWETSPSTNPVVVSDPSGSDVLAMGDYASVCWTQYTANAACITGSFYSNHTIDSNQGLAVVQSTNGGKTWGTPDPIVATPWYREIWYPGNCSAAGTTAQPIIIPANATISSALAEQTVGATTYAYAAWVESSIAISGAYPFNCTSAGLNYDFSDFQSWTFTLYVSSSSNGGSTWGAPTAIATSALPVADFQAGYVTNFPFFNNVAITTGGAPGGYKVTVAYNDYANTSSATGPVPIATFTNASATTWNAPKDSVLSVNPVMGSAPSWLYNGSTLNIADDNYTTSAYAGNQYLVWNDNQTSTSPGVPAIELSTDSGSGWTTPRIVSTGGLGLDYFLPSVSIQSNGTVWIDYYGVHSSNGEYGLYGVFSTDGGASWSGQFVISDAISTPNEYQADFSSPAIVATSVGAFAFWDDCRAASCTLGTSTPTSLYNWSTFYAEVHPVSITSSAAAISATVDVGGAQAVYALPVELGWDTNLSVTVSVPSWVATPNGSYINEFTSFAGATSSSSDPASFTYTSGNLVVHYSLAPASWIAGTISPPVTGAHLSIVEVATLQTVTATLVASGGVDNYNATVPGSQSYTVTASAPKYLTQTQTVGTSDHQTTSADFTLAKSNGWIAGTVSSSTGAVGLASATITVNGTVEPGTVWVNQSRGTFNFSEAWGTYYVNVTSGTPGQYLGYQPGLPLTVIPGFTSKVTAGLKGAWINGSITPYPVTVTINSVPVVLNVTGNTATWNDALPGGTYTIVAHESGYSSYNETYTVAAGKDLNLTLGKQIVLTDHGNIEGNILPPSNNGNYPTLYVNNATETVQTTGAFDVVVLAEAKDYNVSIKLLGYETSDHQLLVTPGNVSWLNVSLTTVPPANCSQTNSCTCSNDPSLCTTTPPPKTTDYTLVYIGVGIVVLLVVVIAAVLLMRRGGGGGGSPTAAPTTPMDTTSTSQTYSMESGSDGGSTEPPASP